MDPVDERKESDGLEMAHQFNTVLNESMVLRDPSVTLTRIYNDHRRRDLEITDPDSVQ